MAYPAVPQGGFHDLPQGYRFMMQGAAGRHLAGLWMVLGAQHAVLLNHTRRDRTEPCLAEKRQEMVFQPRLVVPHIARITLAVGERDVFQYELLGRIGKGALVLQLARAALPAQFKIPVLGKLLGLGEAVGFAAYAPFPALQIGRALP